MKASNGKLNIMSRFFCVSYYKTTKIKYMNLNSMKNRVDK